MFSFLNNLPGFSSSTSNAKSGGAYNSGYRSAGGSSFDPIADARATSARQNALRRPSAAFAVADQGFNSFRGSLSAGWKAEFVSWRFRQALLAELIATTFFVAMGTLSVMFTYKSGLLEGSATQDGYPYRLLLSMNYSITRFMSISLSFGLTLCALVFATGAISGANMNPAVSVSLWLTGKMSALRCFFYIIMQCTGAVFGSFFARSVSPTLFAAVGGAANVIKSDPRIGLGTVLGGEVIGTALLVFTISAAADAGRERSNRYVGALTPLMIGFSVTLVHFFLIPIDNCSINPARSLGSAVVQGGKQTWSDHWVFWAGPLVGGPFSALLYEFVFSATATSSANADDTKDKTARNELLESAAAITAAEDAIHRTPSIERDQNQSQTVNMSRSSMSVAASTQRETTVSLSSRPQVPSPSLLENQALQMQVLQLQLQMQTERLSAANFAPVQQKSISPVRDIVEPIQAPYLQTTYSAQTTSDYLNTNTLDAKVQPPDFTTTNLDSTNYSMNDSFDASSGPPPMTEEESRKYE